MLYIPVHTYTKYSLSILLLYTYFRKPDSDEEPEQPDPDTGDDVFDPGPAAIQDNAQEHQEARMSTIQIQSPEGLDPALLQTIASALPMLMPLGASHGRIITESGHVIQVGTGTVEDEESGKTSTILQVPTVTEETFTGTDLNETRTDAVALEETCAVSNPLNFREAVAEHGDPEVTMATEVIKVEGTDFDASQTMVSETCGSAESRTNPEESTALDYVAMGHVETAALEPNETEMVNSHESLQLSVQDVLNPGEHVNPDGVDSGKSSVHIALQVTHKGSEHLVIIENPDTQHTQTANKNAQPATHRKADWRKIKDTDCVCKLCGRKFSNVSSADFAVLQDLSLLN